MALTPKPTEEGKEAAAKKAAEDKEALEAAAKKEAEDKAAADKKAQEDAAAKEAADKKALEEAAAKEEADKQAAQERAEKLRKEEEERKEREAEEARKKKEKLEQEENERIQRENDEAAENARVKNELSAQEAEAKGLTGKATHTLLLIPVENLTKVDFRQPSSGRWIKAGQVEHLLDDGWLANQVKRKLLKKLPVKKGD